LQVDLPQMGDHLWNRLLTILQLSTVNTFLNRILFDNLLYGIACLRRRRLWVDPAINSISI